MAVDKSKALETMKENLLKYKDAVVIVGNDVVREAHLFHATENNEQAYSRRNMVKNPKEYWSLYKMNIAETSRNKTGTKEQSKQPKKKSKMGIILGILGGIAVIGIVVLLICVFSSLKYRYFAAARAVGAAVACAASYGLFKLYPCETQAFSNAGETVPQLFSVSAPACAAMLLLFALIILDLAPTKKV